ncbi:hypothetical protein QJQ45_030277 [Haematococcus lacustris]|nr:hypothetical protein QJQ45_030277 [Haematococcus lacustris]
MRARTAGYEKVATDELGGTSSASADSKLPQYTSSSQRRAQAKPFRMADYKRLVPLKGNNDRSAEMAGTRKDVNLPLPSLSAWSETVTLTPKPVTQPTPRRCSARLAALAPAAPTEPPLPLDSKDPVMLRQLKEFCEFVAIPNFKTTTSCSAAICAKGSTATPCSCQDWPAGADHLDRWKLTKGQVKHASGLNNARRDTERWLAPIKPHLQHLAAASSAGTSLVANLKHITVTLATWDAVWEVYLDPKWARQRLRLYGAQDRALEQFFKKAQCSSQEATQAAASDPGPSTPPPAKRSKRNKRTKAEPAAEPTQPTKGKGKAKGKAAKAKQPGRRLDRDCNTALSMQRIGESRWRPLELCY